MTIFIASLFLPYTVNFDNGQHRGRDQENDAAQSVKTEDYFDLSRSTTSDGALSAATLAPGGTTDVEKIFVPELTSSPPKLRLPSSQSAATLRSLVHLGPYFPVWGKNLDANQPESRAKSPPPASVLRHNAVITQSPAATSLARPITRPRRKANGPDRRFSNPNYTVGPCILGNGGLVSAIEAVSNNGILEEKTWVGTIGIPTDALEDSLKANIAERLEHDFESLAVWVGDNDLNGHYEHYCKTILWPVLHYQVPDHPKSKAYEDHSWIFYVNLNQAFADRIAKNWKRGDSVWIHDYHLLLVPGMVRKQLPDAQIGFYLHTAFPSSEIFRCLATRGDLLEGLLGANMVGFQTREYVNHFLQTCSRLLNVEVTKNNIILEDGRLVHVEKFCIGVDPATVHARRENQEVKKWVNIISEKYADKKLLVARDKLDSIGGVRQKLLAYELFLDKHPEYKQKVVLIQIATSSTTEDVELGSTIADIATRINSKHSSLAHQPLVFLKQDINYSQWLALLTVAHGLVVTSLREGMNLMGHEFILCQDGKCGHGQHAPLIVSEFTGSAALLKDGALCVNPWDHRQCAESVKLALDMSSDEKEKRWHKMHDVVLKNDAITWYQSYAGSLDRAYQDHSIRDVTSVPRLSFPTLQKKYDSAFGRLLVIDYEGTLAASGSLNDIILTTPQKAIDVLNDLIEDKKNTVYVMSSRQPEEMERLFKRVPELGLIAENGAYLLEARSSEWIPLVDSEHVADWKAGVRGMLKYYEERIEKSMIEDFNSALVFNYGRATDKQSAFKQAGECANHINDACRGQKVHAIPIEDGLQISSVDINKSSAAKIIEDKLLTLSKNKDAPLPEFLLVMGDSRDDEYVFDWAHAMGQKGIRDVVTVAVSQRNTTASCTMTQGVTGVLSTLQKLAGQTVSSRRGISRIRE